jgi:hypothetical protein
MMTMHLLPYWLMMSLLSQQLLLLLFVGWGLFLARSQNIFYLDSTHEMRMQSAAQAYLYVALAFTVLISATSMYWSTAQVIVSLRIRKNEYDIIINVLLWFFMIMLFLLMMMVMVMVILIRLEREYHVRFEVICSKP